MGQKVNIIPYIIFDGVPTFKDSDILNLWDRMVEDNTVNHVFQDGSIKTRNEFLKAMKSTENFLILIYWKEELSMIMWANRFQGNFAQNNFCCFKNLWGKSKVIQECARTGTSYLFKNLGLDMLLGMTPKNNRLAIRAVRASGATIIGSLPCGHYNYKTGESTPTLITCFTKEGGENESLR